MKILFGGTRGTSCVADKRFMRYGGDTTAVLIAGAAGERVIIDAGTGLRRVADALRGDRASGPLTLLMTHFHLDHVMGLPSFAPIYNAETDLTLISAKPSVGRARDIMVRLMRQPFWPVQLGELRSRWHFRSFEARDGRNALAVGNLMIRACAVQHPGGCHAFRIDERGRAMVFATDIEWPLMKGAPRRNFLNLCCQPRPAECLIMDGQFKPAEYAAHKGWGHSTWENALQVAEQAGIRRVFVTHHSPHCDDRQLAEREREMADKAAGARFARDGMEVIL